MRVSRLLTGYLTPMEAGVELFFGLIMALNLSNTLRLALIGQPTDEIIMIITIAILGCNLAWGMVDGVLNIISEHYKDLLFYQLMVHLNNPLPLEEKERLAREYLHVDLTKDRMEVLGEAGLRAQCHGLIESAKHAELVRPRISANELGAGTWCVLLNLLAGVLILSVYHLLVGLDLNLASALANIVGGVTLFLVGFFMVKRGWTFRFLAGMAMVGVGFIMLLATIALGG